MTRRVALLLSSTLTVFVLLMGVGVATWLHAPGTDVASASASDQMAARPPIALTLADPPAQATQRPDAERSRAEDSRRSGEPGADRRAPTRVERPSERDDRSTVEQRGSRHSRAGDHDD